MGTLVAAMATSHAMAMMEPLTWDEFREKNRENYKRRYGVLPELTAGMASETNENNVIRYQAVRAGHDRLARDLEESKPDVLLVIGDDQNELYQKANVPQIAIYNGGDFIIPPDNVTYKSRSDLANELLRGLVQRNFDVSISGEFPENRLKSHAFAQALERLVPARDIPAVPIFVNSVHVPGPSPSRCLALGRALKEIITRALPPKLRVAAVASGGLSHFTAGYPWKLYNGPFKYGEISVDFDRKLIERMQRGEGERLADELTSDDLLDHGGIEFRSWLVVLGMVGEAPIEMLAYETFYRANMAMGVGRWKL